MAANLPQLIAVAADLMGPDEPDAAGVEYLRGMTELLAYGFPSERVDSDRRKEQIAAAILAVAAIGA